MKIYLNFTLIAWTSFSIFNQKFSMEDSHDAMNLRINDENLRINDENLRINDENLRINDENLRINDELNFSSHDIMKYNEHMNTSHNVMKYIEESNNDDKMNLYEELNCNSMENREMMEIREMGLTNNHPMNLMGTSEINYRINNTMNSLDPIWKNLMDTKNLIDIEDFHNDRILAFQEDRKELDVEDQKNLDDLWKLLESFGFKQIKSFIKTFLGTSKIFPQNKNNPHYQFKDIFTFDRMNHSPLKHAYEAHLNSVNFFLKNFFISKEQENYLKLKKTYIILFLNLIKFYSQLSEKVESLNPKEKAQLTIQELKNIVIIFTLYIQFKWVILDYEFPKINMELQFLEKKTKEIKRQTLGIEDPLQFIKKQKKKPGVSKKI